MINAKISLTPEQLAIMRTLATCVNQAQAMTNEAMKQLNDYTRQCATALGIEGFERNLDWHFDQAEAAFIRRDKAK